MSSAEVAQVIVAALTALGTGLAGYFAGRRKDGRSPEDLTVLLAFANKQIARSTADADEWRQLYQRLEAATRQLARNAASAPERDASPQSVNG